MAYVRKSTKTIIAHNACKRFYDQGMGKAKIAKDLGISRNTVKKYLEEYKEGFYLSKSEYEKEVREVSEKEKAKKLAIESDFKKYIEYRIDNIVSAFKSNSVVSIDFNLEDQAKGYKQLARELDINSNVNLFKLELAIEQHLNSKLLNSKLQYLASNLLTPHVIKSSQEMSKVVSLLSKSVQTSSKAMVDLLIDFEQNAKRMVSSERVSLTFKEKGVVELEDGSTIEAEMKRVKEVDL